MATFGQRIKQLREGRNLTQEQLAKPFSVHRSTISKWEKDKAIPGKAMVIKIVNYFKVSIDFLLADEEVNGDDGFEDLFMKIFRENRDLMSADEQQFLLEMVGVYIGAIRNKKGREANAESSARQLPQS